MRDEIFAGGSKMKFFKATALLLVISSVVLTPLKSAGISGFAFGFGELLDYLGISVSEKNDSDELPPDDVTPKRGNNAPIAKESSQVSATAASGWYCKHTEGGIRPPCPPEMSYITKYDGYYLGNDEKVIYLTFDAGYENGNIEKILDTLKSENVHAAFFILDNLVMSNRDLVERMINEGHTVCNHTAKHKDMTKVASFDEFKAEMEKMETVYYDAFGCKIAPYFRPPEGKVSEQSLAWAREMGYKTIMWSYAYADWDNNNQMPPNKAIEKVLAGTHNGEVILLHPTSSTNAEILPRLISEWRAMGYSFGTLDELTADKA